MCKTKKPLVVHPFLFCLFPVLFLYARNMKELPARQALAPGAIVLACTAAALLLLSLVLRDLRKAGLVVSVTVLLFFSYMPLLRMLGTFGFPEGHMRYGAHSVLIPAVSIAFSLIMYLIYRAPGNPARLTTIANLMGAFLVSVSFVNIGVYAFKTRGSRAARPAAADLVKRPADFKAPEHLPNIYYIIMDAYARADVLEEIYGHDNSEFLACLADRGFYVASKSRANYSQTSLSLASSLNMEYLDELVSRIGDTGDDRKPLKRIIINSKVRRFLQQYGYRLVSFWSGYQPTTIENSDTFLRRDTRSEFTTGLLSTMPLGSASSFWGRARALRLFTLETLGRLHDLPSPRFVIAHVVSPHPPFLFGPNGEELTPINEYCTHDGSATIRKEALTRKEYLKGYAAQLTFLNWKLLETIDVILANEEGPPVIIIQGDHGPGAFLDCYESETTYFKERLSILNAYYLPDGASELLYETITPVNTFRVIFNRCLGTDYELLEDRSYFACWDTPYKLIDVTDVIGTPADVWKYERLKDEDYFPPLEAVGGDGEQASSAGGV